jgi:lipid-A-disaccharide synthase
VVVVANSPGEISGWARPVVASLRSLEATIAPAFGGLGVVVVVPPCPFASGRETEVAAAIEGVDAVVAPSEYLKYALFGVVPKGLRPLSGSPGVVVHLGGDPMHSALLSRRLGYPAVLYTDRTAGFVGSFVRFLAEDARVEAKLRKKGVPADKITIVGNLMIDGVEARVDRAAARAELGVTAGAPLVCLMPGSRRQQISCAMPFFLRVAEIVKKFRGDAHFVAVLSPYVGPSMVSAALSAYAAGAAASSRADSRQTHVEQGDRSGADRSGARWGSGHGWRPSRRLEGARGRLVLLDSEHDASAARAPEPAYLIETDEGVAVKLVARHRYGAMAAADVAVAMPGTVTAELAFLGVPTVVAVPTNMPEEVPLPGLPGLLGAIPYVGRYLKRIGVQRALERIEFTAIPNKRQRRMITPEVRGIIGAQDVAIKVLELLQDAKARGRIALELRQAMGQPGASLRVASVVLETLMSTGGKRD